MLTFIPLEEIDKMDAWEGAQLNQAKEILAYELTKLVHGEEEANKAKTASLALFAGGSDDSNMPTTNLTDADLADGKIGIMDLLVKCSLAPSKSEARRLIAQGGVFVDEVKVESIDFTVEKATLTEGVKIRKGKKTFHKAIME